MQANRGVKNTVDLERETEKLTISVLMWTVVWFFFFFFHKCLSAVKPDTLTDMTNQMTEKVGLVHGLPYVADRQGFAATLEQVRTDNL